MRDSLHTRSSLWCVQGLAARSVGVQHKRKRKAAVAAKAAKKSQEMDDLIEIHAPEEGIQVPPVKRRDDGSSKTKKRAESATSSKATEAESADRPSRSCDKKKTLSSSISVVGRSRSDRGPVPSGTNGSERHRSRSGDQGRRGHGSERRHDSPRSCHSPRRRRSGERTRPVCLREGPALGPDTLTRRMLRNLAVLRGGRRRSSLLVLPLIISVITWGHRSRSGSQHHDRRESVDSVRSWSSYVSRCEVQLSPVAPQQTEKRTITVIPSPPRPAEMDDSAGVTGPADSAALADSAGVTGPTDSAEAQDSAGYESAVDLGSTVEDEPEIVYDSVAVADPAQDQDPGRCRLSTPTGLSRWRLGTPTGLSRWRLGTPTGLSRWRLGTPTGLSRWRLGTPTGLSRWRLGKGWGVGGPGYPGRDYASCKTRHFHGFWCQQSDVSVSSEKHQPGDLSWLYVNVDSHATKDGLGYGSSRHPVQARWSDTDDQTWSDSTKKIQDSSQAFQDSRQTNQDSSQTCQWDGQVQRFHLFTVSH